MKLIHFFEIADMIKNMDFYDIINIHYFSSLYTYFIKSLMRKTKSIIVSYWGSDFFRVSNRNKNKQKKILDIATCITFTNGDMEREFNFYHNDKYAKKIQVCRFGLKVIEKINELENAADYETIITQFKEKYNLAANKTLITCGYNSAPEQQHIKIIEQISMMDEANKKRFIFLFPMTYGNKEHRLQVATKLKSADLDYRIFENYMDYEDVAILRKITDIMIHVQTTDQFSGSMMEVLFSGNIVVNGSWLNYSALKEKKVFYVELRFLEDIGKEIITIVNSLEDYKVRCRVNKEVIRELSGWESNAEKWYTLYVNALRNCHE